MSVVLRMLMVLCVAAWSVPTTWAAGEAKPVPKTSLFSGEVKGAVIDMDGKTRARGVTVEIYDATGAKRLHRTVTDNNGKYALPKLAPGNYRLLVASRVMTDVTVMTDGEIVELDFRVPHVYLAPTDPPAEQPKDPKTPGTKRPGATLVRFALVSVGVGAAVAIPLAVGGSGGGSDHDEASPSV